MSTTSTYLVSGMTCAHCVNAVTEEVSGLAGVSEVTVDLDTGVLTVTSDTDVPFVDIAGAVDEAGYAVAPA
ncbi:MAG: heavy-metal-associated domain-containing protein [Microlunatus sp.]|nr:heavy-metal-associated domain-containing protein [Microlunatus sp.]MDN5771160.1 heavy-metal-associated domain-containing protein [Microlunatus sp.]